MAYRELELTLLSAQDLKSVNLITRMDVYAVVSISGNPLTRQCTEPDIYGGRNPCWNTTFRFAVPATASANASLHVLLRAERFLGDRDVGEVIVPVSEILATASGVGPQPPQVASYQVRKLHRYEPRGVLNVSYRLGPVVAPVLERAPEKPVYAPVGVPPQPSHQHPSAVAYQPAPAAAAPGPPAVRVGLGPVVAPVLERAPEKPALSWVYPPVGVAPQPSHQHPSAVAYQPAPPAAAAPGPPAVRVAVHDEAAQNKSPVVTAYPYPVGVPQHQQQASHPPAKPDAYRPPSPSPPPPRPGAVHAARHEEARAPARAPAPSPRNNNGFGQQPGPTHVYMGPHSQIIFGGVSGAPASTTAASPPPTRTSPARSIISPAAGKKGEGNWALLTQGGGNYASAAESMSVPVISSPRSRMEDRWRPSVLSQAQAQAQAQQQQEAARSPVSSPQRLAASPFSSRSSSFSSPLSPYSSASAHPSPFSSASSHSSTGSHYSASSAHPSITNSPVRSPAVSEATHGTNNTFRSTSSRGTSPLPRSSPVIPNHSSVVPRSELTLRDLP